MPAYVDTHCHLDFAFDDDAQPPDVAGQVGRARAAGVTTMITIGTDVASSEQCVATAQAHEGVFAAVGIHPNDADGATPEGLARIEELALADDVVAIGETGLDHYRDWCAPAVQDAAFRAHVGIAKRTERALVIHCRDAWPACLDVLAEVGAPERTVLHCYSGDLATTRRVVAAGYYLSFAGNVSFRNAQDLRDAAALAPAHLLLTETDSPFMAPVPHRGTRNEPMRIPHVVDVLAEAQGVDHDTMAATVLANARRAFKLPGGPA